MAKKKLGRGLSALIPEEMTTATIDEVIHHRGVLRELDLDQVQVQENQPRMDFDQEALEDLKISIQEHGVLQPILVRKIEDKFEIIAGERRYRASKMAEKKTIPALVLDVDEKVSKELSIIENVQREDLNPVEEALAYKNILLDFKWTQEELGTRLGKSRSYITNVMRLLNLEEPYLTALKKGEITSSQGRSLLALSKNDRKKYYQRLLTNKTNIREIERATKKKTRSHYEEEQENMLCEYYGTKVRILGKKKGGKIELSYYSLEDLERLLGILMEEKDVY